MVRTKLATTLSALAFASAMAVSAQAAVVINVVEQGGDVIFTTSGSLDLTNAQQELDDTGFQVGVISGGSNWYIGSGSGLLDSYLLTSFDGPFGTNTNFLNPPDAVSGDGFYLWGEAGDSEQVGVQDGYVSGSAINSMISFANTTFAAMGLTEGVYNYAIPSDTITLNIGDVAVVPLPAGLPLLLAGLGGIGLLKRKRKTT